MAKKKAKAKRKADPAVGISTWQMVDATNLGATRRGIAKVSAMALEANKMLVREMSYIRWMREQAEMHLELVNKIIDGLDELTSDSEPEFAKSATSNPSDGGTDAGSNQGS